MPGLSRGKTTLRDDRPCGGAVPSPSLDRGVSTTRAQEMRGEGVDMWTVAPLEGKRYSTRGPMFFLEAIYLSLTADSLPCHEERQVFSAGEISCNGFNGKKKTYSICYQTKIEFNCFEMSSLCLYPIGIVNKYKQV